MTKIYSFILFLVAGTAYASVGSITDQVNAVSSIQRQKTVLPGTKGAGIEMQDVIRTGAGKVGIKFVDDTRVQVTENSRLVIDDFVYDPKSTKGGKLAVNIMLGTVRYASGQVGKNNPQSVAINTPTATIAVRGTDFSTTVDELGRSVIVLLPSCPSNYVDVERDCITGKIEVITDAGRVILDKPFQATKTESRGLAPTKPVLINLTEDSLASLLILSPPRVLVMATADGKGKMDGKGALDVDFLKSEDLDNALDKIEKDMFQDRLSRNLLDTDFLANILDIINAQLAAQQNLLKEAKNSLLPDYVVSSGVTVVVEPMFVELCRESAGDSQCVSVPKTQNTTITQIQGPVEIKNRVNSGGSTIITLIQK